MQSFFSFITTAFRYHVKKLRHAVESALYLIWRYLVWPKVRSKWPVCDYDVKRV